jgi:hypothetical protein
VAPPTDWLTGGGHYIERYMSLPNDNVEGYNNTIFTRLAEINKFSNKKTPQNTTTVTNLATI